jgi:TRAP-type C4-dicarboxylate transport system substrate-binding protein
MKNYKCALLCIFMTLFFTLSVGSVDTAETIHLKMSSFTPPPHFMNKGVLEPWIEMVERETNGKVQIELYAGSTLGKPQDQYDMAVKGIADITWGIMGYTPGRFPLSTVMDIPFMSPSAEIGSAMIQQLFDMGYFDKEYSDVKVLALGMPTGIDLHTRKREIRTLKDMKGMRVRIFSPIMGDVIKKWGGVPVSMPATEVYVSLERGVLDAVVMDPTTLYATKLNEVVEYHTRADLFSSPFFFVMNKSTWNSLPPDVQRVIQKFSGMYFAAELNGKRGDKAAAEAWKQLEADGHAVFVLKGVEKQRWEESALFAAEKWVEQMEKQGLPGRKVYVEALRLKKEYSGN